MVMLSSIVESSSFAEDWAPPQTASMSDMDIERRSDCNFRMPTSRLHHDERLERAEAEKATTGCRKIICSAT